MSPTKTSVADGSSEGLPLVAEKLGVRTRPVRVTVDLDLTDYDTLRDYAHEARMTHADVLRVLVRMLEKEPIRQQVCGFGSDVVGRAR